MLYYDSQLKVTGNLFTLTSWERMNPVQQSKYHGFWCPGSLRRQDISVYDIDYVK